MDVSITKRLHISGLTPAITPEAISQRLSTFGTVKVADGFGLTDGLGQPRKFGYVTLETTSKKLTKCLNVLNGSTWKGAKLRIGEAKPDFAERLASERQEASEGPPKKRQKRYGAMHAVDMLLVTPDNVAQRPGWKVTPLGRIMKHAKIRPEHPLPPISESKPTGKQSIKKKKKRVKEPDIRARRRTIDMTKWGSVHLKGMFLDAVMPPHAGGKKSVVWDKEVINAESSDDEKEESESIKARHVNQTFPAPSTNTTAPSEPPPVVDISPTENQTARNHIPSDVDTDIALEKSKSLNLLASLFGDKDEMDWVGRESVGSDIDEEQLTGGQAMVVDNDDDDDDIEYVPLDNYDKPDGPVQRSDGFDEVDVQSTPVHADKDSITPRQISNQENMQSTTLKDLFAPREDAGFSLLGHLDLDLELDNDILGYESKRPAPTIETVRLESSVTVPVSSSTVARPPLTLDPKLPLFFPLPSTGFSNRARPKDVFDIAKDNRWNWRDPKVGFYRTDTEEDIRKKWEEQKSELTKDWKRRWREASKINRRRGGRSAADGE